MKRGMRIAFSIVETFFATWALTKVAALSSANIFCVVMLILSIFVIVNSKKDMSKLSKGERIGTAILGTVFAVLYALGDAQNWVYMYESKLFRIGIAGIICIGLIIFFTAILRVIFHFFDDKVNLGKPMEDKVNIFLIGFCVCILAWLPYFLYLYPGVVDPDGMNQFNQILGNIPYNNHHPWVHTMMMKVLFNLGKVIGGTNNAGLAANTVFQLLASGLAVGYFLSTLKKVKAGKWIIMVSLLFFALVPYNAVSTVVIRKDVLFSYAILCLSCSILRICDGFGRMGMQSRACIVSNYVVFTIMSVVICLFRSNGLPAYIIVSIALVIFFRKKLLPIAPIVAGVLLLAFIVKGPVMNTYNVKQPDFVESVTVPLQLFSRVLYNDRNIPNEDILEVKRVIDTEYVKELYIPSFGDNMKELVRAGHPEYLEANKLKFLEIFIRTGIDYPLDYFAAYVDLTIGYWFPDCDASAGSIEGIWRNDDNMYSHPLIYGSLVIKAKEIWQKLGSVVPIYGSLWSIGAVLWYSLVCFVYVLAHNDRKRFVVFVPGFALMFTLLIASPVSGIFRYAYPLIVSLPLYIAMLPASKSEAPETEADDNNESDDGDGDGA